MGLNSGTFAGETGKEISFGCELAASSVADISRELPGTTPWSGPA